MTTAKVTEVSACSTHGFEPAVQAAVARAAETLHNLTGAWIEDQWVIVNRGSIQQYCVRLRVSFLVDE